MKICIIQKQMFAYFGVMAVAGALKQAGHRVDVLIAAGKKDIIGKLEAMKPDVIGFSVMSSEHKWLVDMVYKVRQYYPYKPIVVGGVHAILYPDDVLNIYGVDYVCRGEGETYFPLLVEQLLIARLECRIYEEINNISLIPDLDTYPEDRSVYYDHYPQLTNLPQKIFMSSRGCPYYCSFCANSYLKEVFRRQGEYIRRKSPEFFIAEIKNTVEKYGAESLFFCDDLFIYNLEWLEKFTFLYKKEIAIPYICTARADVINEDNARLLSDSGCHTVSFGIETGNEFIRKNILNKYITDREFIDCSWILRRYDIRMQTSNMFCLPDETIEDAISTIDLNIKLNTDFMFTTIFLPFPRTKLAEYCIEKGYLKSDYTFKDMPESFVKNSVLNMPDKTYIINLHKVAHLCIRFRFLKPLLIFMAAKIKCDWLFFLLYLIGTTIRYKNERKLTYFQTLRYLWTYRRGA